MSSPSVAAVLVHFRTPRSLARSLAALRIQTLPLNTTLVVDNSARLDGANRPPIPEDGWQWLPAPTNIGFAAACNLGATRTADEYLLFINADLMLEPEACSMLLRVAQDHPDAAVVGPRIYGADGKIELSARQDPTVLDGLLGRRSLTTRIVRMMGLTPPTLAPAMGHASQVDWISGACMFVRRSAFEEVGGFDEGYWMYWEDADLCRRLRAAGWSIRFEPAARGHHMTGSSGTSEQTIRAFHASASRFYARHIARHAVSRRVAAVLLSLRCRVLVLRARSRPSPADTGKFA
jgi:N-acetylglucosaminyl-diphospho-decaprenol L-rhamnosyltransferase